MGARLKKHVIPKMSSREFENLLIETGACFRAKQFCKEKTLQNAWAKCTNPSWMTWLLARMRWRLASGWPTGPQADMLDRKVDRVGLQAYNKTYRETKSYVKAEAAQCKAMCDVYREYITFE